MPLNWPLQYPNPLSSLYIHRVDQVDQSGKRLLASIRLKSLFLPPKVGSDEDRGTLFLQGQRKGQEYLPLLRHEKR